MILAVFVLVQSAWIAWAAGYAIYWTARNTQREATRDHVEAQRVLAFVEAHVDAKRRVRAVIDAVENTATWAANLPAGSYVEGIELAGMQLVTGALPAEVFAPGTPSMLRGYAVRTEARIAVHLRTQYGSGRVVMLNREHSSTMITEGD